MKTKRILIVGGDSFLGHKLANDLGLLGHSVTTTTRQKEKVNNNSILLDLAELPKILPTNFDYSILLAGIWNYQECETSQVAWKVNVDNMQLLAKHLLLSGSKVSFVSSNTVFGGERPWCHENDEHSPMFAYAEHKSAGESAILKTAAAGSFEDRLSIVRLTKILGVETSPIPGWLDDFAAGKPVTPFSDLIFAPISVEFAAKGVAQIALSELNGNFHLSGKENIDYCRFAINLAEHFGFDPSIIKPTTSTEAGVSISFLPTYSGLGMNRTQSMLGISPQTLTEVMDDLLKQYKSEKIS
jgi:dTDP-4-dehydrorhamnose reductase